MKFIIKNILKFFTKIYLKKYHPKIVAITGSSGKTSAKEAVFIVVKSHFKTRKSEGNYNTEIGVPLSVFGVKAPRIMFFWPITLVAIIREIYFPKMIPEILVIEMAADRPGDIKYFTEFIKPDIAIVTAVGEFPVHVERYSGPKAVADEKANLIKSLDASGVAILNYDDEMVRDMQKKTKGHIFTFGFGEGADVKAESFQNIFCEDEHKDMFCGLVFKISAENKVVPLRVSGVYGRPFAYSALVAFAVGNIFGINFIEMADAFLGYKPIAGRLNMLDGINGSKIIDDTYNSSLLSAISAVDVLKECPGKRKIAVFGDMKELGKYEIEAHNILGEKTAEVANYIVSVGEVAKNISIGAIAKGFDKNNIFEFENSIDAGNFLKSFVQGEDFVLIKGSQSMRMELATEAIMRRLDKNKELLVRQYWPWKDKYGHPRLI